jgi:hypothetical protein
MYGKPTMTCLNIRCTYMVQKASHIWMPYFVCLQSQHFESSDCPNLHPPSQSALPPSLYGSITFTHLENILSTVKLPYPMLKSIGKTHMVEKSSLVKQLFLNYVCKLGLKAWNSQLEYRGKPGKWHNLPVYF